MPCRVHSHGTAGQVSYVSLHRGHQHGPEPQREDGGFIAISHGTVIVTVLHHHWVWTHLSHDDSAENDLGKNATNDLATVTPGWNRALHDCALACIYSRAAVYHNSSQAYVWGDFLHIWAVVDDDQRSCEETLPDPWSINITLDILCYTLVVYCVDIDPEGRGWWVL